MKFGDLDLNLDIPAEPKMDVSSLRLAWQTTGRSTKGVTSRTYHAGHSVTRKPEYHDCYCTDIFLLCAM